jgi:D-hexose-6-phosphate mutarotase
MVLNMDEKLIMYWSRELRDAYRVMSTQAQEDMRLVLWNGGHNETSSVATREAYRALYGILANAIVVD